MPVDPYLDYVARFESQVGALAVGAYGKFNGKLVRKLSADEFKTRYGEFTNLDTTYRGIIERGDTINDAVVKLWRERRAELLIEGPEPGGLP
ncbi:MAG: hypothetical protein JWN44_183 [Myxococcales bacterium]|nr:hypothetical protein [Myxococcales bacterium]